MRVTHLQLCALFLDYQAIILALLQPSKLPSLHRSQISVLYSSVPTEPPKTFKDCVKQAAIGTKAALSQGEKLIEVEFPPLPLEVLEDSASSARDIADANTRWGVEFAMEFTQMGKISLIYPDQPELDDALRFVGKDDLGSNITLATIRTDSIKNSR
jgi:hypothetical protein